MTSVKHSEEVIGETKDTTGSTTPLEMNGETEDVDLPSDSSPTGNVVEELNGFTTTKMKVQNTKAYRGHPTLLGLPVEVRRLIVGHLKKLSDLGRVSRVCCALHATAVPLLYARLNLTLGGPQDSQIKDILSPHNPGLQHIQHLKVRVDERLSRILFQGRRRVQPEEYEDDSESEEKSDGDKGFYHSTAQAQVVLGMILEILPRDQLLSFNWNTWEPLSTDNWLKLYTTQRKIKEIEICPLRSELMPVIKEHPDIFKMMQDPRSLYLWPNALEGLEAGQKALQEMEPKIKCLALVCFALRSPESPSSSMQDSSTTPGLISRTLFKHMYPFDRCVGLNLRELYLTDVDLYHASTTLLKVINFRGLESLILDACPGASNVFAEMCKNYAMPKNLKRVGWLEERTEQHDLQTFEDWLQAFKGLQYIHVDIGTVTEPLKPMAINNHADTLRSLSLRFGTTSNNSAKLSARAVDEICDRCTKLRQLCLPFQELLVKSNAIYDSVDIKRQIISTRKLPSLETLCIQDWPATGMSEESMNSVTNLSYYHQQLAILATRLFKEADTYAIKKRPGATRSALELIAFGIASWSHYDGLDSCKLKQALFMRGKQIDPFGSEKMVAVLIDKSRLKEEEEDESIIGWDTGLVFKSLDAILYKD